MSKVAQDVGRLQYRELFRNVCTGQTLHNGFKSQFYRVKSRRSAFTDFQAKFDIRSRRSGTMSRRKIAVLYETLNFERVLPIIDFRLTSSVFY